MKRCFKCGVVKPLRDFYRHPKMADGLLGKCKDCTCADVKRDYRANRDAHVAYEKRRESTPARKALKRDYENKSRKRNPDKTFARYAVANALRTGRLKRLPCEVCGATPSEAHHDDYAKPLQVRWLCFKHHREQHGQLSRLLPVLSPSTALFTPILRGGQRCPACGVPGRPRPGQNFLICWDCGYEYLQNYPP